MFDYIIKRIELAEFLEAPFRHLYLEEVLRPEHFAAILDAPEINISKQSTDGALIDQLITTGYKIVDFPGCITEKEKYIAWHNTKSASENIHTACEGFGLTFRLADPKSEILKQLKEFMESDQFNAALAEKAGTTLSDTFIDTGIQKYLDGYEISPHPDIRRKAITYMVNINPNPESERLEHHTHYLTLKPRYSYVRTFWENNTDIERCWVPWDWCESRKVQSKNNSMVIFVPSDETIHGVKASYDHLPGQRTQLYGNLWFNREDCLRKIEWEELDLRRGQQDHCEELSEGLPVLLRRKFGAVLPEGLKSWLKRREAPNDPDVIPNRLKR